jgi:NADH:ubiquinone oxidoreductase subunit 6 (subunit J)
MNLIDYFIAVGKMVEKERELIRSFLFIIGFFMILSALLLLLDTSLQEQYQMYILFLAGLGFFAFVLGLVLPHKKPYNSR